MKQEEFESYCKAGKIANKIREEMKNFIKQGMKLIEIAEEIDKKIEEANAKPAFPVNLSLNEIAAHYTPSKEDGNIAEGLLTIDFGVEINGYIADLAFSIDLTEDKKYKEMIELNHKILDETIKKLDTNSSVCDIGNNITELLKNSKYNIISNLTGHSLEKYTIHGEISIPNIPNQDQTKLNNKAIAIEPFLTTGTGEVIEGKPSEIFMLINKKNVRDPESRKIISFIEENYKTKPFCKRWLDKEGFKTNFSLKLLVKEGILYNFPVLVEKSKKPVSQAEETIVFKDNKTKVITRS
jgi:methionyl aminopeptidase